jgi:hypothetical protein
MILIAASIGELLSGLLTPSNIAWAVGALLTLLGGLKFFSVDRKRQVALAIYHAFHIVEDIAAETEGEDAFDKASEGLLAIDEYMRANGWRPLKPGERQIAELTFKSMNAQKAQAEKLAASPR